MLQLDPTNAAAHVRLARAYQAQRKFAEAMAACQEALRLNPGSTVAKQRLQRIAEEWALARQAQEVNSFEEALRRGKEQKDEEYGGQAIAYLWRAVELSASRWQSVQSRTALGAAYRARKDPLSLERAAAQYRLVLQHVPDDLSAKNGLAAVLRDQGELNQARRLYEQVLAVAPQDAHALAGLAGVLHDLGDEAGAEERFQQGGKAVSGAAPTAQHGLTVLLRRGVSSSGPDRALGSTPLRRWSAWSAGSGGAPDQRAWGPPPPPAGCARAALPG